LSTLNNTRSLGELSIQLSEESATMLGSVSPLPASVSILHMRTNADADGNYDRGEDADHYQCKLIRNICEWAPGLKDLHLEYAVNLDPSLISTHEWNRVFACLRTLHLLTLGDEPNTLEELLEISDLNLALLKLDKLLFHTEGYGIGLVHLLPHTRLIWSFWTAEGPKKLKTS